MSGPLKGVLVLAVAFGAGWYVGTRMKTGH